MAPAKRTATVSSVVATGWRMKGLEMLASPSVMAGSRSRRRAAVDRALDLDAGPGSEPALALDHDPLARPQPGVHDRQLAGAGVHLHLAHADHPRRADHVGEGTRGPSLHRGRRHDERTGPRPHLYPPLDELIG